MGPQGHFERRVFRCVDAQVYLRVHSGSWMLATMGMAHILSSFPLAYCLYRFIFQVRAGMIDGRDASHHVPSALRSTHSLLEFEAEV